MPDTPVFCAVVTRYDEDQIPPSRMIEMVPVEFCLHPEEGHGSTGCIDCFTSRSDSWDHSFGGPNGDQVTTNPEEYQHD